MVINKLYVIKITIIIPTNSMISTKLVIIVPPTPVVHKNLKTICNQNHGTTAAAHPAIVCKNIAPTKGPLRPNLLKIISISSRRKRDIFRIYLSEMTPNIKAPVNIPNMVAN